MNAVILAMHLNTAEVRELWWDGGVLWAATGGGLEAYDADGTLREHVAEGLPSVDLRTVGGLDGHLAVGTDGEGAAEAGMWLDDWSALPTGDGHPDGRVVGIAGDQVVTAGGLVWPAGDRLRGIASDAVAWEGKVVVGTLQGELHVWDGGQVETWTLPGPAVDLEVVDGYVKVACRRAAAIFDGSLRVVDVPATAAGPVWGTGDGRLIDDEGVLARVPGAVTAVEGLPGGALAIGTADGLYLLSDDGLARLTPEGQICGNFAMGTAWWRGRPVVATFDHGACVLNEDGRWQDIPGLPSTMVNDVLADGDDLWLATSGGLARTDGVRTEVFPVADWEAPRGAPGTHAAAVNALAKGWRVWAADVVGPVSIDRRGQWRRDRLYVYGTSYQAAAACGGEAWFASEDAGVSWTDGLHWAHHDASTGLPDDWIMAVACDGEGRGWAGTYQDGVWRYDGMAWSEIAGLPDPWVLSLHWDGAGLWAGTMGGLYRHTDAGGWVEVTPWLPSPVVHDVAVGRGRALVGTEAGLVELGW